jgi:hypothetical protein
VDVVDRLGNEWSTDYRYRRTRDSVARSRDIDSTKVTFVHVLVKNSVGIFVRVHWHCRH